MKHFDFKSNRELVLSKQHFSGTDYSRVIHKDKTLDINGIVYPFDEQMKLEPTLVVSSIIDHHNKGYPIKHTESRYAESSDGNRVYYSKIEDTVTVVIDDLPTENKVSDNFRDEPKDKSYYEAISETNLNNSSLDSYIRFYVDNIITEQVIINDNIKKKEIGFYIGEYDYEYEDPYTKRLINNKNSIYRHRHRNKFSKYK